MRYSKVVRECWANPAFQPAPKSNIARVIIGSGHTDNQTDELDASSLYSLLQIRASSDHCVCRCRHWWMRKLSTVCVLRLLFRASSQLIWQVLSARTRLRSETNTRHPLSQLVCDYLQFLSKRLSIAYVCTHSHQYSISANILKTQTNPQAATPASAPKTRAARQNAETPSRRPAT